MKGRQPVPWDAERGGVGPQGGQLRRGVEAFPRSASPISQMRSLRLGVGCDSPKVMQQRQLSLQVCLPLPAWMGPEQARALLPCHHPHNPGAGPGRASEGVLGRWPLDLPLEGAPLPERSGPACRSLAGATPWLPTRPELARAWAKPLLRSHTAGRQRPLLRSPARGGSCQPLRAACAEVLQSSGQLDIL